MTQLEIGIGHRDKPAGWTTADLTPGPNVDLVFDASKPDWPVRPNSFTCVKASHVIEHLPDFWGFFEGAWNALRTDGLVMLRLPYGATDAALADPTHLRIYYPASFCCLQPGYGEAVFNPQHKWDFPFKIEYAMIQLNSSVRWLVKKPWRYWALNNVIPHLWDVATEQTVCLRKVERGGTIPHPGNSVPLHYSMSVKDYKNDPSVGSGIMVF